VDVASRNEASSPAAASSSTYLGLSARGTGAAGRARSRADAWEALGKALAEVWAELLNGISGDVSGLADQATDNSRLPPVWRTITRIFDEMRKTRASEPAATQQGREGRAPKSPTGQQSNDVSQSVPSAASGDQLDAAEADRRAVSHRAAYGGQPETTTESGAREQGVAPASGNSPAEADDPPSDPATVGSQARAAAT
jgi:hypothetical protein